MGYYLLYTKDTELCVDIEADIIQALQALEKTGRLAYARTEIPIVESAVMAI
jgi:hypothetical protein